MGFGVCTQRVRIIRRSIQTAATWPSPPGLIGWSASAPSAIFGPGPEPGPSQSFSVSEFVVLEDRRRVVVDHRGFTLGSNVGTVREGLTPQVMGQQVLNVVLPDDDECEDEHPWSWLAELARKQGIDVTADELKELQYEVILTDRVTQWLVTP